MRSFAILAAAVTVSTPVLAAQESPYDPNKVICRSVRESGSRVVVQRLCLTRGEWDRLNQDSQRHFTKTLDEGSRTRPPLPPT